MFKLQIESDAVNVFCLFDKMYIFMASVILCYYFVIVYLGTLLIKSTFFRYGDVNLFLFIH